MVPAMNRTINDVVRTEDSQESQSEIALRPSSAATEVPARSVYDRSSGDIEPAPMRANRRDVTLVDTHHSKETRARFGANDVVSVRGKGRKLCESFTANEWREQYQVLCIALFNYSRQSRADRDEDEGLRDAA
jgi:hypothetical protein